MTTTFGQDCEFGLINPETQELVIAPLLIKGNKREPFPIDGGALQYDNVMLEINTIPAQSNTEFCEIITRVIKRAREVVSPYTIVIQASIEYPPRLLALHDACIEFGCEPDFSAWKNPRVSKSPQTPKPWNLRSAGGNIHIGSPYLQTIESKVRFVKALEIYLGLPSLVFDKDPTSSRRRKLYGTSGSFRPQNYTGGIPGIEYRVLSSYWIATPERVMDTVRRIQTALEISQDSRYLKYLINKLGARNIQKAINQGRISYPLVNTLDRLGGWQNSHLYREVIQTLNAWR